MDSACDFMWVSRITDRAEGTVRISKHDFAHGCEVAGDDWHTRTNRFKELVRRRNSVIQRAGQHGAHPHIGARDPSIKYLWSDCLHNMDAPAVDGISGGGAQGGL